MNWDWWSRKWNTKREIEYLYSISPYQKVCNYFYLSHFNSLSLWYICIYITYPKKDNNNSNHRVVNQQCLKWFWFLFFFQFMLILIRGQTFLWIFIQYIYSLNKCRSNDLQQQAPFNLGGCWFSGNRQKSHFCFHIMGLIFSVKGNIYNYWLL